MPPPSQSAALCALLLLGLTPAAPVAGQDTSDELARINIQLGTLERDVNDVKLLNERMFAEIRQQSGLLRWLAFSSAVGAAGGRQAVSLGGSCASDADCRLSEKAVCRGGVCACPAGHWSLYDIECRKAAAEGEPCTLSRDCEATHPSLTCAGSRSEGRRCAQRVCAANLGRGFRYRLVGGADCSEGHVQVAGPDWGSGDSEWWQVCADGWNAAAARVVCRSRLRTGGEVLPAEAMRGQRVWKVALSCSGDERWLHECTAPLGRPRIGISDCRQGAVAAVRCGPIGE